jgi:DNA-binding NtrC family response regulator
MGLVGNSSAMRALFATVDKVARYKTNILLLGESGVGKELVARALHALGPRRKQLFVPLNCATLGRDLLENELFGHERGAFTGATERKKGLLELADGGTLLLDEIAEMDLGLQAKLLRVIERHEFRRVGGTDKVRVDLTLIASTNRDLQASIRAGKFREDLYYRLHVVTVVVPPLRDRREDIPALIDSFIADFNRRHNGKIRGISSQALRRLMEYSWPGNVRELKNAIERAAVLASGDTLGTDGLLGLQEGVRSQVTVPASPLLTPVDASEVISIPADASLEAAERVLIEAHLRRGGSREAAARALGIGVRTLYAKLRKYRGEGAPGRES